MNGTRLFSSRLRLNFSKLQTETFGSKEGAHCHMRARNSRDACTMSLDVVYFTKWCTFEVIKL